MTDAKEQALVEAVKLLLDHRLETLGGNDEDLTTFGRRYNEKRNQLERLLQRLDDK